MQQERLFKQCKTCGKPFSISVREQDFLKEKRLEPYTRCRECREKNREAKATPDDSGMVKSWEDKSKEALKVLLKNPLFEVSEIKMLTRADLITLCMSRQNALEHAVAEYLEDTGSPLQLSELIGYALQNYLFRGVAHPKVFEAASPEKRPDFETEIQAVVDLPPPDSFRDLAAEAQVAGDGWEEIEAEQDNTTQEIPYEEIPVALPNGVNAIPASQMADNWDQ